MKEQRIAFIGGGNMARSLIGGLIADGYAPARIVVSEPDEARRDGLRSRFGVEVCDSNTAAAAGAAVVVIAVKPQVTGAVASELAPVLRDSDALVVSIAAGVRTSTLARWLGNEVPVVRAMPNTPALVRSGATALFANPRVSATQRDAAESIMRAVGLTLWLDDERLMDVVTALSGSGPAYFFLVMEALEHAARRLGLEAGDARLLTLQTAFGAAKMALENPGDIATLRVQVTSPGGTTERALAVLEEGRLQALFDQAVEAAYTRSVELSELLEGQGG